MIGSEGERDIQEKWTAANRSIVRVDMLGRNWLDFGFALELNEVAFVRMVRIQLAKVALNPVH